MKNFVGILDVILAIISTIVGIIITFSSSPWGLVGIILALWLVLNLFAMDEN